MKIKDDILKIQHKRALHQLYKAFMQDIDDGELMITKRGYEIQYNDDEVIRTYQVVLSIKEV